MAKDTVIRHVVAAFIIAVMLFAAGVLIGYSFNAIKIDVVDKQINELRYDTENMQLNFMYLDAMGPEHTCPLLEQESNRLLKKLTSFGDELTSYEDSKDFGSLYSEVKDQYHFLQIRTWLLQEKMKKECESDQVIILYFYSKKCSECKNQGYILSYFKQNLDDRLMVYALDADWQQPMMTAIKADLSINDTPSLVIEGEKYGFLSKEELAKILCDEYQKKPDFCTLN